MFFTLTVTVFADAPTGTPGEGTITGSWEVDPVAGSIPTAVKAGLEVATAEYLGADLEPVAYFAEQIVAGTKYAVICSATPVTAQEEASYLVVVTFVMDAEGNVEPATFEDFDLAEYTVNGDKQMFQTGVTGGWQIPEDHSVLGGVIADEGILAALNELADRVGTVVEPMAVLGKQIVNGTNYAILCHAKTVTAVPEEEIAVVTLNVNAENEVTMTAVCSILGSIEKPEGEGKEIETGAWKVKAEFVVLPGEVQSAYDQVAALYSNLNLKPVAYFARQDVAGRNYGILCTGEYAAKEGDPLEKALYLAEIYTDLNGNASSKLSSFALMDFTEQEENILFAAKGIGAWYIPEDHTTLEDVIPPNEEREIPEIFNEIVQKLEGGRTGVNVEVMNYLGSQIVAGTNYAFLCHATTVTEIPRDMVAVVVANVDPEGNITIGNICKIMDNGYEEQHEYQFADVPEDEWYTDAIYGVADLGIMTGYEGHKLFGTMDNLSRAQFVTILYRQADEPEVTTSGSFVDIPADAWYADAVEWAKAEGIITGDKGGKYFGPADDITREQLLTMIWRRSGGRIVDYALNFKDVDAVSNWALEAIRWAASRNILEGKDGYIDPQGLTKRCECAAMIYRRINSIGYDAN